MQHYTLIIFDWNDDIISTATLRAGDLDQARRMSDHVIRTQPHSSGFQLWQDGQRLHSTFPIETDQAMKPIAVLAWRRQQRGAC